jgi:hypothetical protein
LFKEEAAQVESPAKQKQSIEIKKALLDNMKCVENWKTEQEILMKKKYVEEQKKIENNLKTDLEKVKEEENQRREQERLKLEKERLRLQELELKQKEEDLLKKIDSNQENSTDQIAKELDAEKSASLNNTETVRKEDLDALIEKIYTEETDEKDILTDYQHETSKSDFAEAQTNNNNTCQSSSFQSSKSLSSSSKSIVITKTSPIVAAALSNDSEEEFGMADKENKVSKQNLLKHVHDSMDSLKTQLLQKGTEPLNNENKKESKAGENRENSKEEAEKLKLEQETIKLEKEKIEKEKEKLRHEAEQLRIERELILLASTSKNAANSIAATSGGTVSSSTSSTSSANDQMDIEFCNQNDVMDQYKILNKFSGGGTKSIPVMFPSSALLQNKYNTKIIPESPKNYQNVQQPQQWLIEEAERQRLAKQMNYDIIGIDQCGLNSKSSNISRTDALCRIF